MFPNAPNPHALTHSWTVPTAEHLAAAEALVGVWLEAPAARLAAAAGRGELASGGGGGGDGAKLRAKSDLFLVRSHFSQGCMSCFANPVN